ncbi:MAG: acyltransferase family protein [Marinoscillum sp.]
MEIQRRYDIDWLRVIAIGLLLIYHISIAFQPWAPMIGFIRNNESLTEIWTIMAMLNVWRIPFLFFVSGMGVAFAIKKRDWKSLLLERSRRILIPFIFGLVCIVPIHIFILQYHFKIPFNFMPNAGHLWFLGNIFTYTLVLSPLLFFLKSDNHRISKVIHQLFSGPAGLLIIIVGCATEAWLIKPAIFELYAQTLHGYVLGLLVFFFGFCCVISGDKFWQMISKTWWICGVLALGLYVLRIAEFNLKSPIYLMSLESNLWVFTMLGIGYKYLNKSNRALTYLSPAAYPIYIVHMIFLYLGSVLIFPLGINPWLKLFALVLFTFAGCFASYEGIRRIQIIRPLFGLKPK